MSEKQTPLAIVGIGCLFPKARDLSEFWANIKRRVDGITEIPASHWSPEAYFDADKSKPDMTYAHRGGFLSPVEFDAAEFGISPNTLEATDAAQLLGLVAAQMALRDAGYGPDKDYDRNQVSVILGVTGTLELVVPLGARLGHPIWRQALEKHGVTGAAQDSIVQSIKDGYVPWQESSFPGLLGNVVAGRIANRFNLGGTNCVVDAACASSLSAAHLAALELESRRSRMVITGGVDCFNDIFMYMCFSKTPALSPTGDAKPFDSKADGTILGEGLGMVVLKRLDDAKADGDKIYAVIKGIGSSSDGRGKSIYAPSSEGQAKALKKAYDIAGVSPETVELVEAHGTGTSVGDGVEVEALKGVYRAARADGKWCALGSVKSMIGHTKAAAGSAAMIKAALALHHKVLPPTIKCDDPLPNVADSPFYVNALPKPWLPSAAHPRRAAASALGFGGSNFHVVLEEAEADKKTVDWDNRSQIFAYSGARREDLASRLAELSQPLSWDEVRLKAHASRMSFKSSDEYRLLLVVEKDVTDLLKLAASARAVVEQGGSGVGVYFGSGAPGKLGVLFAGQGSQYVGMSRDLSCQFPEALETLSAADAAFEGGARLSDLIYPPPAFDDASRAQQETALRSTDCAQPALGAVELSQWKTLRRFGVEAAAFAGHSYGELAALAAAGRLSEGELHALSGLRGRLMKKGDGGRGGMLAVAAPLPDVEAVVREEKLDLVLANKNAPKQTVLSGRKEETLRAAEAFSARGVKAVSLPVSAAFHSPLVASAVPEFRAALEKSAFPAGTAPVYANKTASAYSADASSCRDLLASQLESAVEFTAMIERMHAAGVTRFLEVGPGARLTGLVGQILDGRAFGAAALDSSSGKRHGVGDLARALAQLSAWGCAVNLALWDGGEAGVAELLSRKKAKMPVTLTGANYRSSKPAPRELVKPALPAAAAAAPIAHAPAAAAAPALPQADALIALQRLQEQTARLHQQFLQNQLAVAQAFEALVAGRAPTAIVPGDTSRPAPAAGNPLPSAYGAVSGHGQAAVAPVPAPAGRSAAPAESPIEPTVLAVVAEKTGYPVETLSADMDLESDLGIDSIKRVEIMSALAQKLPDAPKAKPEHLGTLRTLRKIVDFLSGAAPVATGASAYDVVSAPAPAAGIEAAVLAVVAEKTGYPAETLNADMDLESDLGIDSIKRVEIMSALAQKLPNAPKAKPEHLGTLRTLRKIVEFLSVGAPSSPAAASVPAAPKADVEAAVLAVVAEKTGYPAETLNADMDLEADLGIDSIKRVEIMSALAERLPGAPKAKPEHLGTLRTLRKIVQFVGAAGAPAAAPIAAPAVPVAKAAAAASGPLSRLVLVDEPLPESPRAAVPAPAGPVLVAGEPELSRAVSAALRRRGLDARACSVEETLPSALAGLLLVSPARRLARAELWSEEAAAFARAAFGLAVRAARPLQDAAKRGGAVFVTVSRLDGRFGAAGLPNEQDPASGALAGLAKTAAKEWAHVSCKALDAGELPVDALAELVAREALLAGPDEVGLTAQGPVALKLEERAAPAGGKPALAAGDLVLVTGGARGVTAAAALELAKAFKPTLALWGRSAAPADEAKDVAACADEASLKKRFAADGLKPKEIGERCRRVLADREIRATLAALRDAGAKVIYEAVDVRDDAAVKAALARLEAEHGPVRGIVHGAGVLADKRLEDKTVEQFDAVWGTKVDGLKNVLAATDLSRLKALGLFSSSTARYGRLGQSDYAMANEALNKIARLLSRRLPQARVVSIGWGPWDGGMVTDALKPLFAAENVGLIGLEAGGRLLAAELSEGATGVETVVLGAAPRGAAAPSKPSELSFAFERAVSGAEFPFLSSHVLNGKAALPTAVMLELLAHGALHGQPGLSFAGVDELRVLKGVLLEGAQTVKLSVHTGKAAKRDGLLAVAAELRGEGGARHASATILLSAKPLPAPQPAAASAPERRAPEPAELYERVLFHGPDMRFIRAVTALADGGVDVEAAGALPPKQWVARPWRDRWVADPAALDAAFQAMIVWTTEVLGAPSLPSFAGRYRQFAAFPAQGVSVRCRAARKGDSLAGADVDFVDGAGRLVARLEGYECTVEPSLAEAFRRREARLA